MNFGRFSSLLALSATLAVVAGCGGGSGGGTGGSRNPFAGNYHLATLDPDEDSDQVPEVVEADLVIGDDGKVTANGKQVGTHGETVVLGPLLGTIGTDGKGKLDADGDPNTPEEDVTFTKQSGGIKDNFGYTWATTPPTNPFVGSYITSKSVPDEDSDGFPELVEAVMSIGSNGKVAIAGKQTNSGGMVVAGTQMTGTIGTDGKGTLDADGDPSTPAENVTYTKLDGKVNDNFGYQWTKK